MSPCALPMEPQQYQDKKAELPPNIKPKHKHTFDTRKTPNNILRKLRLKKIY